MPLMTKRASNAASRPLKRQRTAAPASKTHTTDSSNASALPPHRIHDRGYHDALLLTHPTAAESLLKWYDARSSTREMPWRTPFPAASSSSSSPPMSPSSRRRSLLSTRAYAVWVSEIMLQQTRVSTVIPFFNAWMAAWPTVQALSEASHDDVLAAWKGLGYYSRATRLWEGAKKIVAGIPPGEERGGGSPAAAAAVSFPDDVPGLLAVPGVGPYTAGAVASIAFGKARPLVDGNVARVLSRQTGLFADMKAKEVDRLVWDMAGDLVRAVAGDVAESDVPGRWNQALMELGSTVCTPRPKCGECPVQETCKVFGEGKRLAESTKAEAVDLGDIEDACDLCEGLDEDAVAAAARGRAATDTVKNNDGEIAAGKSRKSARVVKSPEQRSLRDFAFTGLPQEGPSLETKSSASNLPLDRITAYCSLFPRRAAKKQVPEQDCVVCIIQYKCAAGPRYLIEQRPEKGLLASMWQFPSFTVSSEVNAEEDVLQGAAELAPGLNLQDLVYGGRIASVLHVFTHLRLNMHVHSLSVDETESLPRVGSRQKWADFQAVESATVGTGIKKCWESYKANDQGQI